MNSFRFVDLFCGGGGSITGAIQALHKAGESYEGRGFNHWDLAIKTIRLNHPEIVPDVKRACAPIQSILPDEIFSTDPQRIDCVWASPSCTHHSNAAGGKPRSNQLRSQPEYLLPYLRLTKCRRMFIENVKELMNWGPLLDENISYKGKRYRAGMPDPRCPGKFFHLWLQEIQASGYKVDMQILNAADYGAATSRERLIIQAVRKSTGEKIIWPEPTHMADPGIFCGTYKPWRSAAEIIDWSKPGESIFDRKKPLCRNTLRRIEAGIRKYWGEWAEPFLIILRGTSDQAIEHSAVPLTAPLPSLTTSGNHFMLIQPFLCRNNTEGPGQSARIHELGNPIPTIDTRNRYSLIQPVIIDQSHPGEQSDAARCRSGQPLGTITTRNNWSCVSPVLDPVIIDQAHTTSAGVARSCHAPLNTITCSKGTQAVVSPLFIPQQSAGTVKPTGSPLSTIATAGAVGLVSPFLTEYYGAGQPQGIGSPLHTITTHDRFGLVQGRILTMPDGSSYRLDITHRMLTTRELANATGFPGDYQFAGGDTAAKKQIGNAVCPDLAEALYRAILAA